MHVIHEMKERMASVEMMMLIAMEAQLELSRELKHLFEELDRLSSMQSPSDISH